MSDPSWWQVIVGMIGVAGTLLLAFIAIFGKEKFIKLKFVYTISKIDQEIKRNRTLQVFRVKIKNESKRAARNVIVSLVDIRDKKSGKFYERKDFIHMPLEWTNIPLSKKVRNIAAGEEVYVDIGYYNPLDSSFGIATNPRVLAANLSQIISDAELVIRLNEENGFTEEVKLDFKLLLAGGSLKIVSTKILSRG